MRLWVRFGGHLNIGSYTNINAGSEIRCDLNIGIGSYCQISYNVNIWDTNTHSILEKEERREIARKKYPCFGFEGKRPDTKPIIIGDDCRIGMNSTILKGSIIGKEVVVGYGTLIPGRVIPDKSIVTSDIKLRVSSR